MKKEEAQVNYRFESRTIRPDLEKDEGWEVGTPMSILKDFLVAWREAWEPNILPSNVCIGNTEWRAVREWTPDEILDRVVEILEESSGRTEVNGKIEKLRKEVK